MAERKLLNINEPVDDLPDWAHQARQIGERVLNNPLPFIGGVVVVLLCLAAAGAIQLSRVAADRTAATAFAKAAFEEDDTARMTALEAAAEVSGPWGVESAYLLGEEAIAKAEWDKARTVLGQIVKDHPDSPLAPRAAEGLAFIDESTGAIEQAIEGYQNVASTWPDSFAGRCQPYNIGRVQETSGNLPDAVAAYKNQAVIFPESKVAAEAEVALDRLRVSNPELFADEQPADTTETAAEAAPEATAAPATETPETAPEAAPEDANTEASPPAETAAEETPAQQ